MIVHELHTVNAQRKTNHKIGGVNKNTFGHRALFKHLTVWFICWFDHLNWNLIKISLFNTLNKTKKKLRGKNKTLITVQAASDTQYSVRTVVHHSVGLFMCIVFAIFMTGRNKTFPYLIWVWWTNWTYYGP